MTTHFPDPEIKRRKQERLTVKAPKHTKRSNIKEANRHLKLHGMNPLSHSLSIYLSLVVIYTACALLLPRITWNPWFPHSCSPSEDPIWSSSTQVLNFPVFYSSIRFFSINPSNFTTQIAIPTSPFQILVTNFGPFNFGLLLFWELRFCKHQNWPCFEGHPS